MFKIYYVENVGHFDWTGGPEFHIYPYNSKITSPMEKSVTTKSVSDNISGDFCLNMLREKHRGGRGNAHIKIYHPPPNEFLEKI